MSFWLFRTHRTEIYSHRPSRFWFPSPPPVVSPLVVVCPVEPPARKCSLPGALSRSETIKKITYPRQWILYNRRKKVWSNCGFVRPSRTTAGVVRIRCCMWPNPSRRRVPSIWCPRTFRGSCISDRDTTLKSFNAGDFAVNTGGCAAQKAKNQLITVRTAFARVRHAYFLSCGTTGVLQTTEVLVCDVVRTANRAARLHTCVYT